MHHLGDVQYQQNFANSRAYCGHASGSMSGRDLTLPATAETQSAACGQSGAVNSSAQTLSPETAGAAITIRLRHHSPAASRGNAHHRGSAYSMRLLADYGGSDDQFRAFTFGITK